MGMRRGCLLLLLALGCLGPKPPKNRAPTVVFTLKPGVVSGSDSVRFGWRGADVDGRVVGYYYGVDDTAPDIWTEDTLVTLSGVAFGNHIFYLQAVDDSGARSLTAVAPFRMEFPGVLPVLGTDTTFELLTWNIQNFPRRGDSTVLLLQMLLSRMDVDLLCIQEIADTLGFRNLVAGLAGYQGVYSRDDYGGFYQKTGVIYKTDLVTVRDVHQIFWGNDSFPRPPLEMTVCAHHNGDTFDFRLLVLHLKAGAGASDRARRAGACRLLKRYLDTELGRGGEADFIVAGDWNDELDDPPEENVFLPFLEDTLHYRFLTRELAGDERNGSLVNAPVLFDHILVSADALAEYRGGNTAVVRLDERLVDYERLISDHRPVMARFPVFR